MGARDYPDSAATAATCACSNAAPVLLAASGTARAARTSFNVYHAVCHQLRPAVAQLPCCCCQAAQAVQLSNRSRGSCQGWAKLQQALDQLCADAGLHHTRESIK